VLGVPEVVRVVLNSRSSIGTSNHHDASTHASAVRAAARRCACKRPWNAP